MGRLIHMAMCLVLNTAVRVQGTVYGYQYIYSLLCPLGAGLHHRVVCWAEYPVRFYCMIILLVKLGFVGILYWTPTKPYNVNAMSLNSHYIIS
jgi:hypothetical protein